MPKILFKLSQSGFSGMKINKIVLIVSLVTLIFSLDQHLLKGETNTHDYTGEKIIYAISPVGRSEYNDLGVVDLEGVKVNLVTFRTKVLLFDDTEKIYSDPKSLLPYRIERNIAAAWGKEYIIEEYDQKKFIATFKKFKGAKLVSQETIKADGPIHNAIILPFYLRRCPGLKIGWHFTARVPGKFELELVSIDEITVPAGKFQAYHFKSVPDRFEIWISKDSQRLPLRIQGKGFFNYALSMKKHIPPQAQNGRKENREQKGR